MQGIICFMKHALLLIILLIVLSCTVFGAKIPSSLLDKLSHLKPGETLPVIMHFSERPDLTQFTHGKGTAQAMAKYLKQLSQKNVNLLRSELLKEHYDGTVTPLWITNSVVMRLTENTAKLVMGLPFIAGIEEDEQVVTDGSQMFFGGSLQTTSTLAPTWNIQIIKADSVWQLYGITGAGILIGWMDTGVDTAHPALFSKWRGGTNSWFDAINGNGTPYDDLGHGTHTTGTAVGGDGLGPEVNDIGIAHGAKFIAAKMLWGGFSTNAQVITAAQWMLDPDDNPATNDFPDVINNSWFSNTRGSTWFYDAAAAWRAAGIIPVFCAGNSGPATSSTRSPGDYNNCLSVGGTNSADDRYGSTSVGPSPVGSSFPSDGRKPDISAPGEAVYSSFPGGIYATSSGTSIAAPHVTGAIALMLQANHDLKYDEVLDIFRKTSADLGTAGYDYVFGYGRIDALEAVREALRRRMEVQPNANLTTYESGDTVMFSLKLRIPPSGTVYMHVSIGDTTEGELLSSPLMAFTPEYWNVPQSIVIRGRADSVNDGDMAYQVYAATQSTDNLYDQISLTLTTITNIDVPVLSVGDDDETEIRGYTLGQNYPNPFNPISNIEFRIAKYTSVSLRVFDVLGREVATLVEEAKSPGNYLTTWGAADMPAGVYYYRLIAGKFAETKKMLLIK
jgi:subtilisin family serine protease